MAGHCGSGLAVLRRPLFIASAVLYGGYLLATRAGQWAPPAWVGSWLADALCMPVFLALALAVQRTVRSNPLLVLSNTWLLGAWLYVSIWFELLAPLLRPTRYTTDWLDVLLYAMGTLAFRQWLNRPS